MSMTQASLEMKRHCFTLEPRACACCGGTQLEPLWLNQFTATTRHHRWQFDMQNVICQECGFVFVSPTPAAEELQAYYQDSFSYIAAQALDYDVDKRLAFIQRYYQPGFTSYLEIGANIETEFHRRLKTQFERVSTMEPNQSVESDYRALKSVSGETVDMVASYFALEHIPEIAAFFADCRRVLKPNGILIIEIPDITLYGADISAMIFHEHVNHFSMGALQRVAAGFGFKFLEGEQSFCSRNFGFAAAFARCDDQPIEREYSNEYTRNKAVFLAGLKRLEAYLDQFRQLQNQLTAMANQGKKVTLWAANANLLYLTKGYTLPAGVVVVDSNPDKKGFLPGTPIYLPSEAACHIRESKLLVLLCGAVHKASIVHFVQDTLGKEFPDEQVMLVHFC